MYIISNGSWFLEPSPNAPAEQFAAQIMTTAYGMPPEDRIQIATKSAHHSLNGSVKSIMLETIHGRYATRDTQALQSFVLASTMAAIASEKKTVSPVTQPRSVVCK